MGEKAPLPSSVTHPHSREASSVPTLQEAISSKDYSKQHRYAKTEKGKKTHAEAEKRYFQTEKGKKARNEAVKRWRRKQKQQKETQITSD